MRNYMTVAVSMLPELLERLRRIARLYDLSVSRLICWCVRYALRHADPGEIGKPEDLREVDVDE